MQKPSPGSSEELLARYARALEKHREWRKRNLEKAQEMSRQWHIDNAERTKDNRRRWREENKQYFKQYKAEYRSDLAVLEAEREANRKWRERNAERFRKYTVEYRESHKLERALAQRKRDAIKSSSGGTVTKAEILDLWKRQAGKCVFFQVCGNHLAEGKRREWHNDHIEALRPKDKSRPPGTNTIDNIQLLCGPCNMRKHNSDPYVFAQQNGLLFCDIVEVAKGKRKKLLRENGRQ